MQKERIFTPTPYPVRFHHDASDDTKHLEVALQYRLGCGGREAMAVQAVSCQSFPPFNCYQGLLVASPLYVVTHCHL